MYFTQDLFNDYIISSDEKISNDADVQRMICECLPACDYYAYNTLFSNVPLHNVKDLIMDVHYLTQLSFRYKTDTVITPMDLLGKLKGVCVKNYICLRVCVSRFFPRSNSFVYFSRNKTTNKHIVSLCNPVNLKTQIFGEEQFKSVKLYVSVVKGFFWFQIFTLQIFF